MGGRTPDELESLLEDAVVLRDAPAVAELFEATGVLVAGRGGPAARGRDEIGRAAPRLWAGRRGYIADPRRVLLVHDLALVAGGEALNIARRGADGMWRYAISVLGTAGSTEEERMHTMAVRISADPARRDDVVRHLRDDIVPWARSRPGFVSGQWLVTADGKRGMGVMVFESAEAAEQAAEAPRNYARDDTRAWNIDGVEVYEQVAAAEGAELVTGR